MSRTFLRPDPRDEEAIAKVKAEFESVYGVDKKTRTPEQWKALVDDYGMKRVCLTDGVTPKEVRKIIMKTFK